MRKLIYLLFVVLVSCSESSQNSNETGTNALPNDSTSATNSTEEIAPEDRRTLNGELLAPIEGTYFWVKMANDMPLYEEPCALVNESLDISYDATETPGWYINMATNYRNYNYYVLEVSKNGNELVVKMVDSNNIDIADEPIETWAFEPSDEHIIWRMMDSQNDQFLLPMAEKETVMVDECTDFAEIFHSFPTDWIDLTEGKDEGEMYVFDCECEPGGVNFMPGDNEGDPDYIGWSGGCDGDSYEVTKITKANNKFSLWYKRFERDIQLDIDYDYYGSRFAKFTYTDEDGSRSVYRIAAQDIDYVDHVKCEEEEYGYDE